MKALKFTGSVVVMVVTCMPIFLAGCSSSEFAGAGRNAPRRAETPENGDDRSPSPAADGEFADGGERNVERDGAGESREEGDPAAGSSADDQPLAGVGDLEVDGEQVTAARKKCGGGNELSQSYDLHFASTRSSSCPWGVGFNMSQGTASTYVVRAIREQTESLSLPAGSVICGAELKGQSPSVHYDDYLMIVVDGFVAAAAQHTKGDFLAAGMKASNGVVKFDGSKAVGSLPTSPQVNKRPPPQLCPESGTCEIPPSQVVGTLAIGVPDSWFALLPPSILKRHRHDVSVIVTGQGYEDPTGSDCTHTGLDIRVTVRFVPAE